MISEELLQRIECDYAKCVAIYSEIGVTQTIAQQCVDLNDISTVIPRLIAEVRKLRKIKDAAKEYFTEDASWAKKANPKYFKTYMSAKQSIADYERGEVKE